jgi:hypothetical protein
MASTVLKGEYGFATSEEDIYFHYSSIELKRVMVVTTTTSKVGDEFVLGRTRYTRCRRYTDERQKVRCSSEGRA